MLPRVRKKQEFESRLIMRVLTSRKVSEKKMSMAFLFINNIKNSGED